MGIGHPFDPGSPDPSVCPTLDGLQAAKSLAEADGWVALPYDTPEEGIVGWEMFKDGTRRRLEHALYGKKLRPLQVCTTDVGEFRRFLAEHEGHDGCAPFTRPLVREVGFVCPCGADRGTMTAVTVPLSVAKDSADLLERALEARGPWDERLSRSSSKSRACP